MVESFSTDRTDDWTKQMLHSLSIAGTVVFSTRELSQKEFLMSNTPTDTEPTGGTGADRNTLNTDTMKWVSAIVALAGLGLVAYPFMFEATEAATWSDVLAGTVIFLLGGYNFYQLTRDRLANVAVASLATLLGLWALVSPAVIEMGSSELATTTAGGGLIVAALSAYNAYATNRADTPERAPARA